MAIINEQGEIQIMPMDASEREDQSCEKDLENGRGGNNKIKNITLHDIKERHHHHSRRPYTNENEGQPSPQSQGIIYPADTEDNRAMHHYQESQKRTDQWTDNLKDLKKRKQEERYKIFEKEELERRKIDEQEKKFQQKLKEEQLAKANVKLFQNTQQVRALNSKLLYSDALQGREEQIQIKNYIKDIDKKRQQFYHEETLNQIKQIEEEDRQKNEQEKQKLKKFEKDLRKQHKQVKKQYINKYKEEMEEGEFLRLKAEAAIREQAEKQQERRARNMQNRKQVNIINEKNKELKAFDAEKERAQEAKIQQYRKKQEIIQDLTKKRQHNLINEKIIQREELYKKQSFKMSQTKNNDQERLQNQIQELEKKKEELQHKKTEEKNMLKKQYESSLKDQINRKKKEKQQGQQVIQNFNATWKDKLTTLKQKETNEEKFRKNLCLKNVEELKQQMEEKQIKREEKFKQQLFEAQEAKANIQNQEKQFKSYAQKCIKEWESNGKNLYPIIKHLTTTMKQN